MELVEQNSSLGRVLYLECGFAKRLPHIHDRKPYLLAFLWPQPLKKLVHALFAAVLTSKPDRAAAQKISDDDAIRMSLADGNFVDPNDLGPWSSYPAQLLLHVLLVQLLDCILI